MSHAPACQIGLIKSAACQNNQHVKPQQQSNRSGTSNHTHHPQHVKTFSVSNRSKNQLYPHVIKCQSRNRPAHHALCGIISRDAAPPVSKTFCCECGTGGPLAPRQPGAAASKWGPALHVAQVQARLLQEPTCPAHARSSRPGPCWRHRRGAAPALDSFCERWRAMRTVWICCVASYSSC